MGRFVVENRHLGWDAISSEKFPAIFEVMDGLQKYPWAADFSPLVQVAFGVSMGYQANLILRNSNFEHWLLVLYERWYLGDCEDEPYPLRGQLFHQLVTILTSPRRCACSLVNWEKRRPEMELKLKKLGKM